MSDADEYLKEIEELKRKEGFKKTFKTYKDVKHNSEYLVSSFSDLVDSAEAYLKSGDEVLEENRAHMGATAYHLMHGKTNPEGLMKGALLYEKLGKGRRIIPGLLKEVEQFSKTRELGKGYYKEVENFIKRNTREKPKKSSSLEGRVSVFILLTIAGIALSLSSMNSTGYTISSLIQTTSGLLGILFFIAGLVGMFFNLKG